MTVDLRTRYMGIELKNPLIAGPTPMTGKIDKLKELEEAGVAAVTLPSLFEEQISHDELQAAQMTDQGQFAEAWDFFPAMENYNTGPDSYLERLREAKKELRIPVFASLNGNTPGGWIRYAKMMQDEGADALELNFYDVPTDIEASPQDVENRFLELIASVKQSISIPLGIKVGPYFSALLHLSNRIKETGAEGLICFNRFIQPDIDLDELQVRPGVELSTSYELRLPLRWIAILRGRVEMSLGGTCGVHSCEDVMKLLLAGADATYLASALLKRGSSYPAVILAGMKEWLESNEYESIEQLKGSMSQINSPEPDNFERANYMKALINYSSSFH